MRPPFFHILVNTAVFCLFESSHPGGCLSVVLMSIYLQFYFLKSLFQIWLLIFIVSYFLLIFLCFLYFIFEKIVHLIVLMSCVITRPVLEIRLRVMTLCSAVMPGSPGALNLVPLLAIAPGGLLPWCFLTFYLEVHFLF